MDSLAWQALAVLRGPQVNLEVAHRALDRTVGKAMADRKAVSLANYFSRIINGHVPHVSLTKLQLLAIGLGYPTMSTFFIAWEQAMAALTTEHESGTAKKLAASNGVLDTAQLAQPSGTLLLHSTGESGIKGPRASTRTLTHAEAAPVPTRAYVEQNLAELDRYGVGLDTLTRDIRRQRAKLADLLRQIDRSVAKGSRRVLEPRVAAAGAAASPHRARQSKRSRH